MGAGTVKKIYTVKDTNISYKSHGFTIYVLLLLL